MLKHMKLRKDVLTVFKELRKKSIQIAIVSDLTTKIQLKKLKALKINDYVDVLVTSESVQPVNRQVEVPSHLKPKHFLSRLRW